METKVCSICKVEKDADTGFHKQYNKPVARCKMCYKLYYDTWYAKVKPRKLMNQRINKLKSSYGLTLEQYDQLLLEQNNSCKICKRSFSDLKIERPKDPTCIDHCHKTGIVRGILCHKCNLGIGHLNDSVELLENAIQYLTTQK